MVARTNEPVSEPSLQPGDIFLTRGTSLVSRLIRLCTRHVGESRTKVNHVGLVVEGGPLDSALVVEALGLVSRHRLWERYALRRRTAVAVYRPIGLEPEAIERIVRRAESYVGREYGYAMILAHLADWLLLGSYVFRRLAGSDAYPICSWVVAHAFAAGGQGFGVEPGEASPDDIWDFVTSRPRAFAQVRELLPLRSAEQPANLTPAGR